MSTPPKLSRRERDALYRCIVVRLTAITDVYMAIDTEDWELADRLTREFADLFRLFQDLDAPGTSRSWRPAIRPENLEPIESSEAPEQIIRPSIKRGDKAHERRQPDLTDPSLDARDLNGREARAVGEILLGPLLIHAQLS